LGASKLLWIVVVVGTTITGWIAGVRMRRRVHRVLRKEVADAELTSINLWMQVEDDEERKRGGGGKLS
jgi:hypothetical protein